MGLSVSAAAAIVLIGFFLVFGTIYPAIEQSQELEMEARLDWIETQDARSKADMLISGVVHEEETMVIDVVNTGGVTLKTSEIEVLMDGHYQSHKINSMAVDGINNTRLWNPGQVLTVTLEEVPSRETVRIVVVNEFGTGAYFVAGG